MAQLLTTPDSVEAFGKKENHDFLVSEGVFKADEFHALLEVKYERYIKHLMVESHTLMTMVKQYVIPAAQRYQASVANSIKAIESVGGVNATKNQRWLLGELSNLVEQCFDGLARLGNDLKSVNDTTATEKKATLMAERVCVSMSEIRNYCDKLESMVDDLEWPLPKYREMLFIR